MSLNSEALEFAAIETAYRLREWQHYGSEDKALAALRRRKTMRGLDRGQVSEMLTTALKLIDRANRLINSVLDKANRSFHPQLTEAQYSAGTALIRRTLLDEHPRHKQSIEYLIAMLWHMPRVR